MESRATGSKRLEQGYGPVRLLAGRFIDDSDASSGAPIDQEPRNTPTEKEEAAMTHAGLLFTEALAAAHNAPDVRQDRIEAIRAQIANGTYEIDIKRLAEKLIRENPCLFDD